MAVPHLQQLTRVGGKAGSGVKAVIGPGSGLGMSILIPAKSGGYEVMNSEGGHADLAAGNPLELEVLGILLQQHREACWESVLSGPGLVRLYSAIVQIWGGTAEFTRPEEISAHGVDAQDPICHQTLELFFGWLGAAAGNLALTVCASGGVYIGGGIVPALEQFALTSPLRRRFEERVGLTDFIRDIPVYIIMDPDPGLIGAAACLHAKAAKP
jgi:glucokinase